MNDEQFRQLIKKIDELKSELKASIPGMSFVSLFVFLIWLRGCK
jgi:hypothetical protein